jgi:DNA-binding MarR family transcriptional regulator
VAAKLSEGELRDWYAFIRAHHDVLVERQPCEGDARAIYAALTEHGQEVFLAAAQTHVRGIRDYFLDKLAPADRTALRKSLEVLCRRD